MKGFLFYVSITLSALVARAQTYNDIMMKLKFTQPTPEIASLFKFSEVPVDLSCGTPNINIDLYNIQSVSLQHNISLSYHASALRVNEIASIAGLGWNLNAGGAIMRVSRGKKKSVNNYNDGDVTFLNESDMNSQYILDHQMDFYNIQQGEKDVEPDEYSFSIEGLSGKFFQDRNYNFVTNTKSNIKIVRSGSTGFKVTNGSGVQYIFDVPQYTDGMGVPLVNNITGLNVSKIISADNKDTISFEYVSVTQQEPSYTLSYNRLGQVPAKSMGLCNTSYTQNWLPQTSISSISYRNNILSKITFKGGYVLFGYSNREDRRVTTDYYPRLSEIKVFTNNDKLVKYYTFLCDIFQSSGTSDIAPYVSSFLPSIDFSKRLRLYQINQVDVNSQAMPLYKFEYNSFRTLPPRFNFSQDYWGFYNGKSNTDPIRSRQMPQWSGGTITVGGANKSPDSSYAKASLLMKMTYPTGGYSTFEYEGNMSGATTVSGGVRIKAIQYFSSQDTLAKREVYTYGTNGFGTQLTAQSILDDDHFYFTAIQTCPAEMTCGYIDNRIEAIRDQPLSEIGFLSGSPIAYSKVTKTVIDPLSAIKLVTEFNYDISDLNFQWPATTTLVGRKNMPINNCWKGARLLSQIDYKDNGNTTYSPVRSVRNSYKKLLDSIITFVTVPVLEEGLFDLCMPMGLNDFGYTYIQYPLQTQKVEIDSTFEVTYSSQGSDSIAKTTVYEYDRYNLDFYLRNILTKNSLNQFDRKELKYPFDFLPNAVMSSMISRNRLNEVIQQTNYSAAQSTSVKRIMKDWFNDGLVLETNVLEQYINGAWARNLYTVNTMNNASKVLEYVNETGIKSSLIWNDNNKYLVAQADNSAQSDFAYSSFEDNNKGNWTYTGTPVFDITAPTGRYSYNLSTGNITRSGLTTTGTYVVSYWKKSGTVSVNGSAVTSGRSVNGWTFYEHSAVNPTTGTITISGTNGIIDELRVYPAGSQTTSFAYDPLIGISNQCDLNNRITYYDYDGYRRLILIRDQDRNILKKISYTYNGQTENNSVFVNIPKQGTFTKNNCAGCTYGSAVTYTVIAGQYTSTFSQPEADNLAQADVDANGQTNANLYGSCSAPVASAVTGTNGISTKSFAIQFSNVNTSCTPTAYNTTLNASASNVALGPMNTGKYNVNFSPVGGGSTSYRYVVNGFTLVAPMGTIQNVPLVSTGNQVQITP